MSSSGMTAPAMSIDPTVVAVLGRLVFLAEAAVHPMPPLSGLYDLSISDAYEIQKRYAQIRIEEGANVLGHKIGATSQAIQDLFNIDTPDYGHLFDDMLVSEEDPIPIDDLIQPLVEPEIAFVLAEDVSGPGVSLEDVLEASRGVVPCLEVIDSRIRDWDIKLADTIADNGSSARFVLGDQEVPIDELDLAGVSVVLERNGKEVGRGWGSAALGHPALSAAWLANALGAFGASLPAGSFVLSGSLTTAIPAAAGDRFRADFTNLGAVTCSFGSSSEKGH